MSRTTKSKINKKIAQGEEYYKNLKEVKTADAGKEITTEGGTVDIVKEIEKVRKLHNLNFKGISDEMVSDTKEWCKEILLQGAAIKADGGRKYVASRTGGQTLFVVTGPPPEKAKFTSLQRASAVASAFNYCWNLGVNSALGDSSYLNQGADLGELTDREAAALITSGMQWTAAAINYIFDQSEQSDAVEVSNLSLRKEQWGALAFCADLAALKGNPDSPFSNYIAVKRVHGEFKFSDVPVVWSGTKRNTGLNDSELIAMKEVATTLLGTYWDA